jgi:chromosome segregation ATPase
VSDTPRNDKLTNQTAGCSDALHLVLVDELSRKLERELSAATERNGNLAVDLAAMRQSRNAADDECTRLSVGLADAKQERDTLRREVTATLEALEAICLRYKHLDWMQQVTDLEPWPACFRNLLRAVTEVWAAQAGKGVIP